MALETVVGAIAEHIVNEALSLAAEEFSLVFHFKDHLQMLAIEFEIIQALLADADKKNIQSATVNWLKRLKSVASDAEDVLEEYKYDLLRLKVPQTKWDKGPSSLKELSIENLPNLDALPLLQGLSSLTKLAIKNLPKWAALPSLQGLSSLKELRIGKFSKELDYFPWPHNAAEDAQLYISSLEDLTLYGWPKLTSLPEQIQHLPSLKSLSIMLFQGLEALPEWLGNIPSLEFLSIWECENLKYMPYAEAMQRLTNLQRLLIDDCPRLKEGCTRGSGSEWHKFAHIPDVRVN